MKKNLVIAVLVSFMFVVIVFSGIGPAPNAGDGISDGSGWDVPLRIGYYEDGSVGPGPNMYPHHGGSEGIVFS